MLGCSVINRIFYIFSICVYGYHNLLLRYGTRHTNEKLNKLVNRILETRAFSSHKKYADHKRHTQVCKNKSERRKFCKQLKFFMSLLTTSICSVIIRFQLLVHCLLKLISFICFAIYIPRHFFTLVSECRLFCFNLVILIGLLDIIKMKK